MSNPPKYNDITPVKGRGDSDAVNDGTCHDAGGVALERERWQLPNNPTVLQYEDDVELQELATGQVAHLGW